MTHPSGLRPVTESILLGAIVLVGLLLRLVGIDWDDGHHLHPDERFLTMVTEAVRLPSSLREYFATESSRFNPANAGYPFFVYGTLPVLIVKAFATGLEMSTYAEIPLVGRAVSAVFDTGTIVLAWWMGRRVVVGGGGSVSEVASVTGVTAAALMASSVLSIQNAHFYTVDSMAAFFAAAALAALVEVSRGRGPVAYVSFAISLALGAACRVNLALLAIFFPVAVARAVLTERRGGRAVLWLSAASCLVGAAAFRIAHPYAFSGPGATGLAPSPLFLDNLALIRDMVTGEVHFPPANQWIGRTPFAYAGFNLLVWGLGPAFGIAAVLGLVACMKRSAPAPARLLAFVGVVVSTYHAVQFVPTLRYFLPVVPILAVAAAVILARPSRWTRRVRVLVLVTTAGWALAFTSVYRNDHSRVRASRWMLENVPAGTTVAVEHWDDALPLAVDGTPQRVERVTLAVFDEDTVAKRDALLESLDAADYVVVSSARGYRTIPRSPWRYPMTTRYYQLLFAGDLGFRLERVFTSYPALGPLVVVDDEAEEQFTVYDHPKVLVFAKDAGFRPERARALLEAVVLDDIVRVAPAEASRLYRESWPSEVTLPESRAVAERPPAGSVAATLRWLVLLETQALAMFAISFPWLGVAKDRGFALAKILGWLAPGYLAFLSGALGVAPVSDVTLRAVASGLVGLALVSAWKHRAALFRFVRDDRRGLLVTQGVFWGGFGLFLALRVLNSAVFWGEKPMDLAILNVLYRSTSFPPADPWFANTYLNYPYFGHWLVASTGRLSGAPPSIAFNLGIATLGGLVAALAFAAGRLLAGTRGGITAAVSVTVLGSFEGMRLWLSDPGRPLDFGFFWETSRVIDGTINEFPFWSFLFGDLHAHVLALPFDVGLLYAAALWTTTAPEAPGPGARPKLVLAGLVAWLAGASAATSSWNLPVTWAVPVVLLFAMRVRDERPWRRGIVIALRGLGIAIAGRALFWPFWRSYRAPDVVSIGWERAAAPILDVITIFGPFWVVIVPALLLALRRRDAALAGTAALAGVAVSVVRSTSAGVFFCLTALGLAMSVKEERRELRAAFALVALGASIALMTEVVYVSDRMNTVFKYYLHVWMLHGFAAAVLVWGLRRSLRLAAAAAAAVAVFTSVAAAIGLLGHPVVASGAVTLDGMRFLREDRESRSESEAFQWMARSIRGVPVVLEAQGPAYGSYGRVSMYTGLPTVLGWEGHLRQQNVDVRAIDARRSHVRAIYETTRSSRARALLDRYHVDFVFVGPLERRTYAASGLAKLDTWDYFEPVFRNDDVTIYARPGALRGHRTSVAGGDASDRER